MRYLRIDSVTFFGADARYYRIKDIRPIEEYTTRQRVRVNEESRLDEIATRNEIYGRNGNRLAYKLFDANKVKLVENGGDLGKLNEIKVPN